MKKTLTILLITIMFLTGAASTIAEPGKKTVIDQNNSINNSPVISSELPGSIDLETNDSGITAEPSYSLYPRNYTGKVILKNGYNKTFKISVPKSFEWNVSENVLNGTISVGSSGQVNTTKINVRSNINPSFNGKVTGNISDYFSVDRFQFEEKGLYTAVLGYGVNEEVPFGNYTGELVVKEENQGVNKTVNLSYRFKDEIKPEIKSIKTKDFMATERPKIKVSTKDNIGISKVKAKIQKKNESSGNYTNFKENIKFEQKKNTETWYYELKETSEEADYRVNITAADTSGNKVSSNASYRIKRLDVIKIEEDNFRFDSIWPNDKKSREIVRNEKNISASLILEESELPEDSGISFGVLKPGDEQPIPLEEGDPVGIEEEGSYELVVETSSESRFNESRDYSGVVKVVKPEEHVNLSDIVFGGTLQSDQYPKPTSMAVGKFRGRLTYLESANESNISELLSEIDSVNDSLAVYVGTVPRKNCQGTMQWDDGGCTGFSIGEMERVEQNNTALVKENEEIREGRKNHWIAIFFAGVLISGINYLNFVIRSYSKKNLIYPVWRTRKQKR